MITRVETTKTVDKQLANAPTHIATKFSAWVAYVGEDGLEKVRRIPGFHDEPLKGDRKGQRSIRLNPMPIT